MVSVLLLGDAIGDCVFIDPETIESSSRHHIPFTMALFEKFASAAARDRFPNANGMIG
jgi:hypothetical protein